VAAGLIADAESTAEPIPVEANEGWNQGMAPAAVVEALTAMDPDRAERLARSITNAYYKSLALAGIARI
jgi:hypothetical protein